MLVFALACSDATAPLAPATVVFRAEPSCRVLTYSLFIDGQPVGERTMAPSDSATFHVDPGPHALGAVALDGFTSRTWFTDARILGAGDRYTARLDCQ